MGKGWQGSREGQGWDGLRSDSSCFVQRERERVRGVTSSVGEGGRDKGKGKRKRWEVVGRINRGSTRGYLQREREGGEGGRRVEEK